jgi:hypothetical protein
MVINGSADIFTLVIDVIWDISNPLPQILLTNLSTGPNLAGCTYWFVATSPTGTYIHQGSETTPDKIGIWTSASLNDAWPRPFSQIEYSGAPYLFTSYVKDSAGNIYTGDTQAATICRPQGNTPTSKNTYGLATAYVQVNCPEAGVFFQDTTNHSYQGQDGVIGSSVLRVVYPIDETGTIPAPFVADHFSVVQVPITYSSDNYQFLSSSIYDYDQGNNTTIRIKYQSFNQKNGSPAVRFPVLCNIDLCPLVCEYTKFITKLEAGSCADSEQAHQDLVLMNSKMALIMIGIKEPLCGIDVPTLIEEVKTIGGFTCDCCNAATGIIPTNASIIAGYTFQIVPICGNITGEVVQNGNLIQFELQDISYVFKICDSSPSQTTAFSVEPSQTGCQKTYCLSIDVTQFGYDLGNAIKDNADLLNFWQTIIGTGSGTPNLIVDGGCIFQSSTACDYTLTLANIPVNTTYALLTAIKVGTINYSLNYSFNLTNLPGLQTYLNALGYGAFTVLNPLGQTVVILSGNNPNDIQSLTYKIAGTTFLATLAKSCTGYIPINANQVVQNIINYICGLDDTQVFTSDGYVICYIDPADGVSKTETVAAGEALTTFITALLSRGCQTIEYIHSLVPQDCDGIKTLFPSSVAIMQANDYFLGTKAGDCARILPAEAFLSMLTIGYFNDDVVNAFCALVDRCRGSFVCTQYSTFSATTDAFDSDCASVVNFSLSGNTPLTVDAVTFANAPAVAQTIFVEYKLVFDSTWTAGGSSLTDTGSTLGTLLTPVALSSTVAGQFYNIRVYNGCQSPPQYVEPAEAFEAGTIP